MEKLDFLFVVLSNLRAFVILCALTLVLRSAPAYGDGGTVRLMEASGRYLITVFTAPQPLRVGRADVSVLVQDRERGEPILDAEVSFKLSLPATTEGSAVAITSAATHAQTTNQLLYAAGVDLPLPGDWDLQVNLRHADDTVELRTNLAVAPPAPPLQAIWFYLLIPPAAIGLFALHQWRARQGADSPRRTTPNS